MIAKNTTLNLLATTIFNGKNFFQDNDGNRKPNLIS